MILLTGGAGFIGSNILAALNARGRDDVIVVDDLSDGTKCANLAGRSFADYLDVDDLPAAGAGLPRLTGVIHQGAVVDTTARDGRAVMRANYDVSKRMLALARAHGCPFVYASSAAVYGDGAAGFREERACERALTPYAFSKWAFDEFVRRELAAGREDVPIAGLRYFNVYGPGEGHKGRMASVAWHAFQAARRGEAPRVFAGSDGFVRDFVAVADVAAVNLFFLDAAGRVASGIYNVGTGAPRSFGDLGRIVARVAGAPPPVTIPFPDDLRGQYQAYTCADISRLRAAGWDRPFATLEDGLAAYWTTLGG